MSSGMPLNFVSIGKYAEVNSVMAGEMMCKKLMEMGVNKGSLIEIVKNDSGPLIIKIGETRLALGRGMAQKVMVSEV
ncbi:FeoA family protein [Clostridium carboxidivorans P7]|uniref:FeoA family protein n=1 Tax=Clostridium carboxidivorans P7 TaxID=536227 RepID=C6PWX7_9CLOT|nr:FeoA domain-containing protein [Clostridium carboxidivorans]EET86283.1 FeoA family protein [Clostridium carboxidivorans P7]